MNACIIEDDADSLLHLKNNIKFHCPQVHLAGTASTISAALTLLRQQNPQILFLDIELPDGIGFDLLDHFKPLPFQVIFTTGHDQYAIRAIKYAALDYLLKPIDAEELQAAVAKAAQQPGLIYQQQVAELLKGFQVKSEGLSRIALPVKEGFDFVEVQDILRCEALNKYTAVFTRNGQKYLSSTTIKEYEELLPDSLFFRVHHAHLVSLKAVAKFYKDGRGGYVQLTDNTHIEVSLRRKEDFLLRFGAGHGKKDK